MALRMRAPPDTRILTPARSQSVLSYVYLFFKCVFAHLKTERKHAYFNQKMTEHKNKTGKSMGQRYHGRHSKND